MLLLVQLHLFFWRSFRVIDVLQSCMQFLLWLSRQRKKKQCSVAVEKYCYTLDSVVGLTNCLMYFFFLNFKMERMQTYILVWRKWRRLMQMLLSSILCVIERVVHCHCLFLFIFCFFQFEGLVVSMVTPLHSKLLLEHLVGAVGAHSWMFFLSIHIFSWWFLLTSSWRYCIPSHRCHFWQTRFSQGVNEKLIFLPSLEMYAF